MSRKERDERKREIHIERRREADPRGGPKQEKAKPVTRKEAPRRVEAQKRVDTPSFNTQSDDFSQKLASMRNELRSISFRANNLPSRVNQLDSEINSISTRIANIQSEGYKIPTDIDQTSKELTQRWLSALAGIQSFESLQSNSLIQRQRNLERVLEGASSINELSQYESQLSNIKNEIFNVENALNSRLVDYQSQYNVINKDLRTTEETIANLRNTSIKWKIDEQPLIAVKIRDLSNDKDGILTLSNYRILFEEVREEVLSKTFIFATEKKTVREVLLDQPIGSIDVIEKGRVGFFKGAGLFIRFKPQTGLDEIKLDTKDNDDDELIRYYNYVISGEAEVKLEQGEKPSSPIPTSCPNCSAPFNEEILKGQTSVRCRYCGTVIKI